MKARAYIKVIKSCQGCPHFCDEGEWCRHPGRGLGHHVIADWEEIPDDSPLPEWPGVV